MSDPAPRIRVVTADDVPAMFTVRTSVIENHQNEAQLQKLGITHKSVTERDSKHVTDLHPQGRHHEA
jgi:hypothetical protein